jgi:uncharacterized membrane protein
MGLHLAGGICDRAAVTVADVDHGVNGVCSQNSEPTGTPNCLCCMDTESDDQSLTPANTMHERAGGSRLRHWLLVSGDRRHVFAVVLVVSFLTFVILGRWGPSSVQTLLRTDAGGTVFSSVIIAIVTSVTLVLSVSQLVLSQQIGSLEQQRDQLDAELGFRQDAEAMSDLTVSPPEPAAFLRTLILLTDHRAETLRAAVATDLTADTATEIEAYLDDFIAHSQQVSDDLDGAEFGSFGVMSPVLNYNYSWKLYAVRALRNKHTGALTADAEAAFDELVEALQLFGPAREYFKAQYFQWEIIDVSRMMLYTSMPALIIAAYMTALFDPMAIPGTIMGVKTTLLVFSAVYTITLSPFAVLLVYVLRVLTMVKRTLATGPFILRETARSGTIRADELTDSDSEQPSIAE